MIEALNKRAYYIAPASMRDDATLGQLIALREAQGWSSEVVPVEALYAYWGHGFVSPEAIRRFLQYQYNVSSVKPEAVIMIGDGNYDWRGFLGASFTWTRLMPPYMADVDRFRGFEFDHPAETSCEACYAQLDGASALDDMLPELLFGRLPVKNATELATVVNKILRYETLAINPTVDTWRGQVGYLVDNQWKPSSTIVVGQPLPAGPVPDAAGPFWSFADNNIRNAQAFGPGFIRRYYDPYKVLGSATHGLAAPQPGNNVPNEAAKALFNNGAAFISYIGHASQFRVADLETSITENYFLHQNQVTGLTNADRLPVLLQMTCLTGSFAEHFPTVGLETNYDETLLMAGGNRGAIAVWGSSGLGVMYGHQPLLSGFFKTYWRNYTLANPPTVGSAAMGGYLQLFADNGGAGEDSLRTYQVLGDPLTRVRAYVPNAISRDRITNFINLPIVQR